MKRNMTNTEASEHPLLPNGQDIKISTHAIDRFRERVIFNPSFMNVSDREIKRKLVGSINKLDWDKLPSRRTTVKAVVAVNSHYFLIRLIVDKKWKGIITCLGRDSWAQFGLKEVKHEKTFL